MGTEHKDYLTGELYSINNYCCGFKMDSMKYISKLPDDFNTKGDAICEKILDNSDSFINCLLRKISDDRETQIKNGDSYSITVGDAAVLLLWEIYKRKHLPDKQIPPLRKILVSEFYNNKDDGDSFESLYIRAVSFASGNRQFLIRNRIQAQLYDWYYNEINDNK